MSREALLANVLDNPEDWVVRKVYGDYLLEHCADDPALAAHGRLIQVQNFLADAPGVPLPTCRDRPIMALERCRRCTACKVFDAHYATQRKLRTEENDALCDRNLKLLPDDRRIGAQIDALQGSTYSCCNRHADQMVCDCRSESVTAGLWRGFIDSLDLSFLEAFIRPTGPRVSDVLRIHPVDTILLDDAALQVEIDRWREGGDSGWQLYFYNAGRADPRTSDYFHMESWEHRAELVDNIDDAIMGVVLARAFPDTYPEGTRWMRPLTERERNQLQRDPNRNRRRGTHRRPRR